MLDPACTRILKAIESAWVGQETQPTLARISAHAGYAHPSSWLDSRIRRLKAQGYVKRRAGDGLALTTKGEKYVFWLSQEPT